MLIAYDDTSALPVVDDTPPAAAPADDRRTRRDIELTIGVDCIEVLQAARRLVIGELAPLRAKYGPGGTFDAQRKAFRSAIANEIALREQQAGGKKPAEAELERLAAGDPRVIAWLESAETDMAHYYLIDSQATELTELINRDQALIRYAAMEPK